VSERYSNRNECLLLVAKEWFVSGLESMAVTTLEVSPKISEHPFVEFGDNSGGTGFHDEALVGEGVPVVEVVQGVRVAHLVEQDMDVVLIEQLDEVLATNPLPPIATRAPAEARGEPK